MARISLDNESVKAINELYHNIEADTYLERHPEIYSEEAIKWEEIGKKYFKRSERLTVLDIGTGIGFVPSIIGKYLKNDDVLICTDISQKMLDKAKERLLIYHDLNIKYIKADALEVSRLGIEADIITMNSVLHHLPDYENVLKDLEKLIKRGGLFIIMHERNQRYCKNVPLLLRIYQPLHQVNRLIRGILKRILIVFGLYKNKIFPGDRSQIEIFYSKVQQAIKNEGICDRKLTIEEINSIVDLHDPDEGGEGFDPFVIHQKFFKNYEIVDLFMNKHLGPWIDEESNIINKLLSRYLKKFHPNEAAIFGMIMREKKKIENE